MNDALVPVSAVLVALAGGAIIGSFLTVVIDRVPVGGSIVAPRSACPACSTQLGSIDLIPILSWVRTGGRCRHCSAAIPAMYPVVESATALGWAIVVIAALGGVVNWGFVPVLLAWVSAAVALSVIDVRHHRLPDQIVWTMYPVTLLGLVAAGLIDREWNLISALVGALMWFVVLAGIRLFSRGRGMGAGDVKLAPLLGALLGWLGVGVAAFGLVLGFVLGAVVGVVLLAAGRAGRRDRIPFGPFLLVGALTAVVAGPNVVDFYVSRWPA